LRHLTISGVLVAQQRRTKILTFHRVIDEIAGDADLAWVRGRGARVHRSDCPFAPAPV